MTASGRALFCSLTVAALLSGQGVPLGGKVADFHVTDLDGKKHRFEELRGNTTVVLFFATRCPVSNSYNERMEQIYREYNPKGVNFLFLNANATETPAEILQYQKKQEFSFSIYKDFDNAVADQFGASTTPESYVIDHAGVLRYHGAIDDSQNVARVKSRWLREALDALLRGSEVARSETRFFGCSIKRVRK